jgi:hypothetical protein
MTPTKYNQLNELLAEFSQLSAELSIIEAEVNDSQIEAARPLLPRHANATARLGEIETKLRAIAVENPELFPEDKKTHQTPFGAISFRTSKHLKVEDEEKTVLLIKVACGKEATRAARAGEAPRFTEETLLRTIQKPDLEALEKLDDALLAMFQVERKTDEKFAVKPLAVKADKLIKADAKRGAVERPELN